MEGLELICFEIISSVGMARSLYIEAIRKRKPEISSRHRSLSNRGMNPLLRDIILMQS